MFDWLPDWSTAEWTSVLATAFAALAALAALGATWLQLVVMRRARVPHLQGAVRGYPDGTADLAVANAGPGLGVQVGYLLVDGDYLKTGLVEGGFLQAGEEKAVPIQWTSKSVPLVWACRDIDNNLHVWSHHGGYLRVRRRRILRREGTDIREHFRHFYPDTQIPAGRSATT